jgi:hypothetical protein
VSQAAASKGSWRVDPQNWRRGDVLHTSYAIRCIKHYEFQSRASKSITGICENTFDVDGIANSSYLNVGATTVNPRLQTTGAWVTLMPRRDDSWVVEAKHPAARRRRDPR